LCLHVLEIHACLFSSLRQDQASRWGLLVANCDTFTGSSSDAPFEANPYLSPACVREYALHARGVHLSRGPVSASWLFLGRFFRFFYFFRFFGFALFLRFCLVLSFLLFFQI
jgi:hypothetical protein